MITVSYEDSITDCFDIQSSCHWKCYDQWNLNDSLCEVSRLNEIKQMLEIKNLNTSQPVTKW